MRFRDTSFLKSDIKVQQLNTRLECKLSYKNWNHNNVEDNFSSFQRIFESVLAEFAPLKTSKSKNKITKPQWFNEEIAKAISKRNRLHRAWSKNKSNTKARERFVAARKKCELAVRQSKKLM